MTIGPAYRRPLLLVVVVIAAASLVSASDALYEFSQLILDTSEAIIARAPVLGMVVFVLLGAASAMLAFFSSAVFVPVGIVAWGATVCMLLLWLGWWLGGVLAFAVGRYLGRSVAALFIGEGALSKFETRLTNRARFVHVLAFQLAVPSEIPGYVLGTLHYRFSIFALALALAELPYAAGTVFLGIGFLERNAFVLLGVGIGGVAAGVLARSVYRRVRSSTSDVAED